MTKIDLFVFKGVVALALAESGSAHAVNLVIDKGWPCNVFLEQTGAVDAVGNFADFNLKNNPQATSAVRNFVAGENADFLASLSQSFNARVESLPFIEPLSFNLKSKNYGAKFGVDVCIPELDATREDIVAWTVDATALGALMAPAGGDWFQFAQPKISMNLMATNCNASPLSDMSESDAVRPGFCEIDGVPLAGEDALMVGNEPVAFSFKLMANRQAVVRFTVEEQSNELRRINWDAGLVQIDLTDPSLPRLVVEDLLGKQLFFAPESDLLLWPGCASFNQTSGLGLDELKLQGPNNSLDLSWTGKDTDCPSSGVCPNGNVRTNNFSFPIQVTLEDGSPAAPNTSANLGVAQFSGEYDDTAASGESSYPSSARIAFDAELDDVYRYDGKTMFSTTVSRLVGPQDWRSCRVWFKRDNGFNCALLPEARLQSICASM